MPKEPAFADLDAEAFPNINQMDSSGSCVLFDQSYQLDPTQPIFSKAYWENQQAITGSASGRGTTLFLRHQQWDLILRPYLRGGLPGKILTNQFFFTGYKKTRAWQEFLLLLKMLELDLPVPKPVAAGISRFGLIYHNNILILRIPGAKDLHAILCQQSLNEEQWSTIGRTIRKFHDHQVYHHDLNIRNIMLDNDDRPWLIDFDKCGIRTGDPWKQQNLQRLHRSLVKEQTKNNPFYWDEAHWQHLLSGYHAKFG